MSSIGEISRLRSSEISSIEFRSIFRERRSDFVSRTHLRHSSHKGLQLLLTFLYTGQVTFTWRNLHEILNCAKELHVTQIFDISEQFLLTFDKRHVFRVLDLSRRYGLRKAFYHCHDYLCRHFTQAIEMKSFLQVPYSTVVNLLSDESMRNRDETVLLTRLLNWIISNHHDNQQNLLNLFVNIRWNQFDYSEQREWLTAAQQLTDNPKLIALINQQMTYVEQRTSSFSTLVIALDWPMNNRSGVRLRSSNASRRTSLSTIQTIDIDRNLERSTISSLEPRERRGFKKSSSSSSSSCR